MIPDRFQVRHRLAQLFDDQARERVEAAAGADHQLEREWMIGEFVQWQVSTDGGKTFSDLAGANDPSLTLNPAETSSYPDRYRAVFTNSAGSDTSASASVIFAS